ncbi:MAG TPA: hypothetical protein PKX91_04000 [Clostridia bacterium]|nr:hypothetical protein [Clostridia bacterium]
MKRKVVLIVLVIMIASVLGVVLAGCGGDKKLPGVPWANEEILVYEMLSDKDEFLGTLEVKTTKLEAGEHELSKFPGEKVKVSSSTTKGARVVQTAKDTVGNIIMYSESILNGFVPAASYKEVKYGNKNYTLKARYDGKKYVYSYNGEKEKTVRIKSGFMDNELMYFVTRCYELEGGYSTTYTLIDPQTGAKEKIVAATSTEGRSGTFNYIDSTGASTPRTGDSIIAVTYSRDSTPKGKSIAVFYTKEIELSGDLTTVSNRSKRIPTLILENDIKYVLKSATIK